MEVKKEKTVTEASLGKTLFRLLSECRVQIQGGDMSIEFYSSITKTAVLLRLNSVLDWAWRKGCTIMNLYERGALVLSLPIMRQTLVPRRYSADDRRILENIWNKRENYITITRKSDTKVLLINDPKKMFNGAGFLLSELIGTNASRVWTPQALELRQKHLDKDGYVNCLEYEGRRVIEFDQGIHRLHPMAADFQNIIYLGEPCILGVFQYSY